MDTWTYGLRRELANLDEALNCTSDKIFAGERLDGRAIEAGTFQHCTFANISFLKTKISNVTFVDCVFTGCYFRRAIINGCSFTGCRFVGCDFSHLSMMATNLMYARFKECMINYEIVRLNLPNEHNLREELCRNLNVEATRLGYLSEARSFRLEEVRAREENLWAAILWKTEWYRRHYYGARRIRAGLELGWSYVNRILWGYGERVRILILNLALFIFVVLPLLFWLFDPELLKVDDHGLR